MNTKKTKLSVRETLPMSEATRQRLAAVAEKLKGQELFPEKVAQARQAFQNLVLPL